MNFDAHATSTDYKSSQHIGNKFFIVAGPFVAEKVIHSFEQKPSTLQALIQFLNSGSLMSDGM